MVKNSVTFSIDIPTRRGVVYGRVSTSNESQKSSLDYQTTMFYDYAKNNNIEIVNVYAEVGSGTSITKRKEFKQLLVDAQLKMFDCILTKDVSRWSRDNLGFLETIRNLRKLGIIVYFVDIGLNSEDDEMTLSILAAVAQKEALNTRAKTKAVRHHQVENGAVPAYVFGYDNIKGTGAYTLEVNEEEAIVVNQIFEMYASGIGAQTIVRTLNKAGIKTKRGKEFRLDNVNRILRNKIYIGVLQNNKKESLDKRVEREIVFKRKEEWLEHDRPDLKIVDTTLFYKCQDLLDAKSKSCGPDRIMSGWNLPFSKTIVCAECGGAFRRNRSDNHIYLKCKSHLIADMESCPNCTSLREDDLFNSIKVYMINLLKQKEGIEELIDKKLREKLTRSNSSRSIEAIQSELDEAKKKKMRAMELYINEGNSEVKPLIDKLTKQISNLEGELNRFSSLSQYNAEATKKQIANMFNTLEEFINTPDIRDLDGERFNQLFDCIKVYKDGHLEISLAVFGRSESLNSIGVHQCGVLPIRVVFEKDKIESVARKVYSQVWTRYKRCRTLKLGSIINDEVSMIV